MTGQYRSIGQTWLEDGTSPNTKTFTLFKKRHPMGMFFFVWRDSGWMGWWVDGWVDGLLLAATNKDQRGFNVPGQKVGGFVESVVVDQPTPSVPVCLMHI